MKLVRLIGYLVIFLGLTRLVWSQAASSTITGVVRDASGAVVPGATVAATNTDTGIYRTVPTDNAGRYRVGDLPPGAYQVSVTMEGFEKEIRQVNGLMVGQEQALDFSLQVGATTQQVTVSAAAPLVDTTTATVASGVAPQQLRELPLNGRSFTNLITLQAGAIAPSASSTNAEYSPGPQLSISGARTDENSYMVDGTDVNTITNGTPGGASGYELGVDTIREYQVITSNAKAQWGRSGGGVVNAVTQSGTNAWHGDAFEFLRNSDLDANNFFFVGPGSETFRRNQFGGTLGGPIRKDKTFIFIGFEGLRQSLQQAAVYFVPDLNARAGILPTGTVPVDPRVVPFLNLYPLPNGPEIGGGIADYDTTNSNPVAENFGSARIDHEISSSDSLFGHYTIDDGSNITTPNLLTTQTFSTHNQYSTIQESHIFSPTLLNVARFGINRDVEYPTLSQVANAPPSTSMAPGEPMGQLSVGGLSPIGPNFVALMDGWQTSFQYADDMTKTIGAHTIQFGASVEHFWLNSDTSRIYQGTLTLSNLQNFLEAGPVGTSGIVALPGSSTYRGIRTTMPGFYVQDDYNVSPSLTLNYGLRWEFTTGLSEAHGLLSYFAASPYTATTADIGTGSLYKNHIDNFAPRFGFNYALGKDHKTSIRGGAGTYYNQILGNAFISYRAQYPFYSRATPTAQNAVAVFPNVVALAEQSGTLFRETRTFDYDDFRTPTIYRYNLTLERELPGQMALSLGYVGAWADHLEREQLLNSYPAPITEPNGQLYFPPSPVPQRINPDFDNIYYMSTDGNSRYNALQATLVKRFSAGVTFQINYTWSKSIDDFSESESNESGIGRDGEFGPKRTLDEGLSLFNVPQVFVANWVYELPIGQGKAWRSKFKVVNGLTGGWQIGGILTVQNGLPFTPGSSASTNGYMFSATRANLNPGVNVSSIVGGPPNDYFNTSAFSLPPAGTIGNAARGLLEGPGLTNLDFSAMKVFPLREGMNLQFRAELFNILNHPNFDNPGATIFTSSSGVPSPTAPVITATSTANREIQFALKLTF